MNEGTVRAHARKKRVTPGITNAQATFLADLSRQLGRRYKGRGKSKVQASKMIDECLRALGRKPDHKHTGAGTRQVQLGKQQQARNKYAKYGPRRKPAPVVVKHFDPEMDMRQESYFNG